MSAKVTLRHTVTCYECGAQVTDLTRTKTAIRNELSAQGWIVAIPMWAAPEQALQIVQAGTC